MQEVSTIIKKIEDKDKLLQERLELLQNQRQQLTAVYETCKKGKENTKQKIKQLQSLSGRVMGPLDDYWINTSLVQKCKLLVEEIKRRAEAELPFAKSYVEKEKDIFQAE